MLIKFAFVIFCGGVLAIFALPDHEAGFRLFAFSTIFLILSFVATSITDYASRKLSRSRHARVGVASPEADDLPTDPASQTDRSDWSQSGVDPSDPAMVWQYRTNDQRLGRFD